MKANKKTKAELELEALQNNKRQGSSKPILENKKAIEKKYSIELSEVFYEDPNELTENSLNTYRKLNKTELTKLAEDIKEKGVIVPLIARQDKVLICGHNRRLASIQAELTKVPVMYLNDPVNPSDELQKELMKSENDRRRGGNWDKETKIEYLKENFWEQILNSTHGGNRKNPDQGSMNLAKLIEEQTRGSITEGTAKRLIAEIKSILAEKENPDQGSMNLETNEDGSESNDPPLKPSKHSQSEPSEDLNRLRTIIATLQDKKDRNEIKAILKRLGVKGL